MHRLTHTVTQADSTYSPYAVHLPENNNEVAPPAFVFLGGKGSMFEENVTLSRDTVVSYGGIGWNVMLYYNGSRSDADTLAAEKSVIITSVADKDVGSFLAFQICFHHSLPVHVARCQQLS